MLKKISLLLICIGLLTACSYFEDEDIVKPAKLTDVTSKIQVTTVWTNKTADGALDHYLKLTPAFAGDRIFTVSHRGVMKAIDAKTGSDIWSVKTQQAMTSGVAVDSRLLFVGTDAGRLLAYRQSDGHFVWQAPVSNDILATPVVAAGKVIAKTADGRVYAFDAQNGQQIWDFVSPNADLILRGSSMPKVVGDLVINGIANGQVVALNLNDGHVEWKQTVAESTGSSTVERMTDIAADPVIVDKTIYIVTYQGQVAALALNGKILWQKALSSYAGFTVGPKYIYAVDAHDHIWAFARNSGDVLWEQECLNNRGLSAPTIFGKYLVVGDFEGYVHWLSLVNGKIVARDRAARSEIIVPPLAKNDGIYVMTKDGKLVKYNIK